MLPFKLQLKKVKIIDNIFRYSIIMAGAGTILCVLAILWSIVKVTFPLFYKNTLQPISYNNADSSLIYIIPDNYIETFLGIKKTGELFLQNAKTEKILKTDKLPFAISFYESASSEYFFFSGPETSSFWRIRSKKGFDENKNQKFFLEKQLLAEFPPAKQKPFYHTIRGLNEGSFLEAKVYENKNIELNLQGIKENFLGEETKIEENYLINSELKGKIKAVFLSRNAENLYLADDLGNIENIYLSDLEEIKKEVILIAKTTAKINTLSTIFGETSLLVGLDNGNLQTFSYVQGKLIFNKETKTENGAILGISSSLRDKSFFTFGKKGSSYWYLTNNSKILTKKWDAVDKIYFNVNGSSLLSIKNNKLQLWKINAPHPDFALSNIFTKVKYEGYLDKDYIWQSSAGNDDFEPKYSFIPLIFGSIKGTFYAMLFALPLAIFSAIYVNQFAKPWVRNIVKPTVEIMATIPSVVIGFLAALWLAPIMRDYFLDFILYFIFFPVFFLFFFFLFQNPLKKTIKKYFSKGTEFIIVMPSLVSCFLFVFWLSIFLQKYLFGGDFIFWLSDFLNIPYEQRNAIIISFALGFAVIPIIFTMTDEALSSFPKSLTFASFALGATHWQTLMRVILPTTASGIFAGFIIGFGRAIGETMIVLMATGNTPITSWSLLDGMRTISANIAVEIPEAPLDGTLYRLLFLSAVLLFLLTFFLNFIAELIRGNLRKKYRI